jgi:hypothetical protein
MWWSPLSDSAIVAHQRPPAYQSLLSGLEPVGEPPAPTGYAAPSNPASADAADAPAALIMSPSAAAANAILARLMPMRGDASGAAEEIRPPCGQVVARTASTMVEVLAARVRSRTRARA